MFTFGGQIAFLTLLTIHDVIAEDAIATCKTSPQKRLPITASLFLLFYSKVSIEVQVSKSSVHQHSRIAIESAVLTFAHQKLNHL